MKLLCIAAFTTVTDIVCASIVREMENDGEVGPDIALCNERSLSCRLSEIAAGA